MARTTFYSASADYFVAQNAEVAVAPAVQAEENITVTLTPFPVKDGTANSSQQIATPGFGNASGMPQFERQHRNDNFPGPSTVVQSIDTGSAERPIFSTTDYLGGPEEYTVEFQEISLNSVNLFKRGPLGTDEFQELDSGIGLLVSSSTKDYQNFYYKGVLQSSAQVLPSQFIGETGWRRVDFGSARGTMQYAMWTGTTVSSSPIISPVTQVGGKTDYKLLLYSGKTNTDVSSYVTLPDDRPLPTRDFDAAQYAGMSVFVELLDNGENVTVNNGLAASPINWLGIGIAVQQRPSRGHEWFDANVILETSGAVDVSNQRQRADNLGSVLAIKRWTISGSGNGAVPNVSISSVADYITKEPRFMFNFTFNDDEDNDFGNNMRLSLVATGALDQGLGNSGYASANSLAIKVHAIFHHKLSAPADIDPTAAREFAMAVPAAVVTGA